MCCIFQAGGHINAQDLEKLLRGPVLSISGHISASQTLYMVSGRNPSRKPYQYLLSGNLNLKVEGLPDAPFSFFLSNQGARYTQPGFNQAAWHPSWRWVTLHAGDISMSWSPYTLNGHLFRGAGVDLTPGKWKISLCHGRFVTATESTAPVGMPGAGNGYLRKGSGLMVAYAPEFGRELGFQLFHAADEFRGSEARGGPPLENVCAGWHAAFRLPFRFSLKTDAGLSLIDENRLNDAQGIAVDRNLARYKAVKLSLQKKVLRNLFNLDYERVDPGYRSLGAYYFNHNLENISLGTAADLSKLKLGISLSAGVQRDIQPGVNQTGMTRKVMRFQGNWSAGKKFTLQGNYSNFLSYSRVRIPDDLFLQQEPYTVRDTLNYRQTSSNMNLGAQWLVADDSVKTTSLNWNLSMQKTVEIRGEPSAGNMVFLNGALSWTRQAKTKGKRISMALNLTAFGNGHADKLQFTPLIQAGGKLGAAKHNWNLTAMHTAGTAGTPVVNSLRGSVSAGWKGGHGLNFSAAYQEGKRMNQGFRELMFCLSYTCNFPGKRPKTI